MDLDQLKKGWQKSKNRIARDVHLKKEEMEAIIKKQANKTTHRLSRIFIMGIVTQSLTIIFLVISGVKYWHASDLFIIICASILPISFALYYSWNRYVTLRDSNFDSMNVSESLMKKIEFYKFSYNKWLLGFSLSFVIFIWSLNISMGDFTSLQAFNVRLAVLYAAAGILIFTSYRFSHLRLLKEYEIFLKDLGGVHLTDLYKANRKFRIFKIILISILALTTLLGTILLFVW